MATEKLQIILDAAWRGKGDIRRAQQDMDGLDKAAKSSGLSMEKMGKLAIGAGVALAGMGAAAKLTWNTLKEGAALARSRDQFERLAESIDSTADVMLGKLKDATSGMVSDAELIASAGQIISLGLADTEDGVVRLATLVSELGWDMQQVIMTFANNSKMRLDALGLSVTDVEEKMKALESQGYSMDEAFDLAVIQAGEEKLRLLGNSANTTEGRMKMLETAFINANNSFKESVVDSLADELGFAADNADDLTDSLVRLGSVGGQVFGSLVGLVADFSYDVAGVAGMINDLTSGGAAGVFKYTQEFASSGGDPSEFYANYVKEQLAFNRAVSQADQVLLQNQANFNLSGEAAKHYGDNITYVKDAQDRAHQSWIASIVALDDQEAALIGTGGAAIEAADAMQQLASATGDYFMQAMKSNEFNPMEAALEAAARAGADAYQLAQFGMAGGLFSADEATGFMNEAMMMQRADQVGALIAQGISPEVAVNMVSGMEEGIAQGDILAEEFFKSISEETLAPEIDLMTDPATATWQAWIDEHNTFTVTPQVLWPDGPGYADPIPPNIGGGGDGGNSGTGGGDQQGYSTTNIYANTKEAAAVAVTMAWQQGRARF